MGKFTSFFYAALIIISTVVFANCSNNEPVAETAENALDCSREFSRAILSGDFVRAKKFCVPSQANDSLLGIVKVMFFDPLSEAERKQMKVVSLNIAQVVEKASDTTLINLSNNIDKKAKTIQVIKENNIWFIDLVYYCKFNKF